MRLFSVEGHLYKFISRFWDVVKLNFMWLVFSLPIVTIGASTAAVFSVTLKMAEESDVITSYSIHYTKLYDKNKVDGFVVDMEQQAAKLIDIVHGERAEGT